MATTSSSTILSNLHTHRNLQFDYNAVTRQVQVYLNLSQNKQNVGYVCQDSKQFKFKGITWKSRHYYSNRFENIYDHIQSLPQGSLIRKQMEQFLTYLTKCSVLEHIKLCLFQYERHYKNILNDADNYFAVADYVHNVLGRGDKREIMVRSLELHKNYRNFNDEFKVADDPKQAIRSMLYHINSYVRIAIDNEHVKIQQMCKKAIDHLDEHLTLHCMANIVTYCQMCKLQYTYSVQEVCLHRLCLKCAYTSLKFNQCLKCKQNARHEKELNDDDDENKNEDDDNSNVSAAANNDDDVENDNDNADVLQQNKYNLKRFEIAKKPKVNKYNVATDEFEEDVRMCNNNDIENLLNVLTGDEHSNSRCVSDSGSHIASNKKTDQDSGTESDDESDNEEQSNVKTCVTNVMSQQEEMSDAIDQIAAEFESNLHPLTFIDTVPNYLQASNVSPPVSQYASINKTPTPPPPPPPSLPFLLNDNYSHSELPQPNVYLPHLNLNQNDFVEDNLPLRVRTSDEIENNDYFEYETVEDIHLKSEVSSSVAASNNNVAPFNSSSSTLLNSSMFDDPLNVPTLETIIGLTAATASLPSASVSDSVNFDLSNLPAETTTYQRHTNAPSAEELTIKLELDQELDNYYNFVVKQEDNGDVIDMTPYELFTNLPSSNNHDESDDDDCVIVSVPGEQQSFVPITGYRFVKNTRVVRKDRHGNKIVVKTLPGIVTEAETCAAITNIPGYETDSSSSRKRKIDNVSVVDDQIVNLPGVPRLRKKANEECTSSFNNAGAMSPPKTRSTKAALTKVTRASAKKTAVAKIKTPKKPSKPRASKKSKAKVPKK
ncbi:hoar [Ectropis obliqua nucleopolyhedrovirus]|uniref:Hoar n=1 Tax=Ectropis obliqua nucleopolyhedrovirus TaxID=59376 RepID=Q77SA3_9ABAC|nr:hoar [Ectropis obliqua nucleopolyhedrovirus]AAQ88171.1 hoar [Ectropis obliqua nucleopolyhedrovirus]